MASQRRFDIELLKLFLRNPGDSFDFFEGSHNRTSDEEINDLKENGFDVKRKPNGYIIIKKI